MRKKEAWFWFVLGFVVFMLFSFMLWLTGERVSYGVDQMLDKEQRLHEQRSRGKR